VLLVTGLTDAEGQAVVVGTVVEDALPRELEEGDEDVEKDTALEALELSESVSAHRVCRPHSSRISKSIRRVINWN
jgi:hypothetical protein